MNPIEAYGVNNRMDAEIVKPLEKPVNPPPLFILDPPKKADETKKDTKKQHNGKDDSESPLKRPFDFDE